jgi:DNA-binding MarR family transcriptional regulator
MKCFEKWGWLPVVFSQLSDIKYREVRLQRGQFIFLTRIFECPGINLVELSNILKVDKTTTTKAVQKLMDENYVLRRRNNADKRGWHLFPSEKAQEIYQYIIQEEKRNIEICLTGFNLEERDTVYQLIKRIRENIEQDWKKLKTYKEEPN